MRAMCSITVGQSFKNVPNDYIDVLSVNKVTAAGRGRTASRVQLDSQGNADALATTAKARQSEQGPFGAR